MPEVRVLAPEGGAEGVSEWGMMELQGELVVKANGDVGGLSRQEAQARPGLEIGALDVRGGGGEASLVVGPHKLAGERAELQRPLVALRREPCGNYRVVGVVRHKFAFKKRPQILVTKPRPPPGRGAKLRQGDCGGVGAEAAAWEETGPGSGPGLGPGAGAEAGGAPRTPPAAPEPTAVAAAAP